MAHMQRKSLDLPDETRTIPHGKTDIWNLGDFVVGRITFEPGWQWSKDMKPKVGGDSCQVLHNIYCLSGRMRVKMNDGTEFEMGPGDAGFIAPGHDAWVVGDEPFVGLDWTGARTYAK